jgi:CRP-like cAMP-binding protein
MAAGVFNTTTFLGAVGAGRTILSYKKDTTVFSQGDSAGSVYFIQRGKVKLAIVSSRGKSAVLGIIGPGLFFGEGCLTGQPLRMTTAMAFTECTIVEVQKTTMMRVLNDEPAFAASFITHLLTRNLRIEEDLIDHLFNPSEKRLARILLLLAELRQGIAVRASRRRHQPGNACGDDRDHSPTSELLSQEIRAARIHRIRRRLTREIGAIERYSGRLS